MSAFTHIFVVDANSGRANVSNKTFLACLRACVDLYLEQNLKKNSKQMAVGLVIAGVKPNESGSMVISTEPTTERRVAYTNSALLARVDAHHFTPDNVAVEALMSAVNTLKSKPGKRRITYITYGRESPVESSIVDALEAIPNNNIELNVIYDVHNPHYAALPDLKGDMTLIGHLARRCGAYLNPVRFCDADNTSPETRFAPIIFASTIVTAMTFVEEGQFLPDGTFRPKVEKEPTAADIEANEILKEMIALQKQSILELKKHVEESEIGIREMNQFNSELADDVLESARDLTSSSRRRYPITVDAAFEETGELPSQDAPDDTILEAEPALDFLYNIHSLELFDEARNSQRYHLPYRARVKQQKAREQTRIWNWKVENTMKTFLWLKKNNRLLRK